ncbi:MAG: hypothetical protein JEY97_09435 [Bacteroidales bacterium]|nr:hypothetical protein [Bacteroidales bacterium]
MEEIKMNKSISRKKRRMIIIINYLSLLILLAIYYSGKHFDWPILLIVGEIISIIILISSFYIAFIRTKLWNFVHKSENQLDERQITVNLKALKYSYSIFVIVSLLVIYAFAIAEEGPLDVLIAFCLLYFAHTLPAAICAWIEKGI